MADLFDQKSGRLNSTPETRVWELELIKLFQEMCEAGHPPHQVAYFFCDIAVASRVEESLNITFRKD
jgi:hypothetical protein